MRPTKQARRSPTPQVLAAVRKYLEARCPWETAIGIAGVQRAEDVRWRDAADSAIEAGTEVPEAEAAWLALWNESRMTIAQVAGALVKRAIDTGGKDAVSACKALLPVEGGEAWGPRGPEGATLDEGGGLDEVAVERLSPAQRQEMAEWGVKALAMRNAVERLLREARGTAN